MKEQLTQCKRCGSAACYEQEIPFGEEIVTTWLCMGCGFTTSTKMTEDGSIVQDALNTSPELYKDLMFKDDNGRVWLPSVLTLPEKGMIFVDGVDVHNWGWSAVKAIKIPAEDLHRFPTGMTYKMDMENGKIFKQKDFMDAMDYIGFFDIEV